MRLDATVSETIKCSKWALNNMAATISSLCHKQCNPKGRHDTKAIRQPTTFWTFWFKLSDLYQGKRLAIYTER